MSNEENGDLLRGAVFTVLEGFTLPDAVRKMLERAYYGELPQVLIAATKVEPFVVKHYSGDDRPSIKGNGFDGLEIGESKEEAENFISFINSKILGE
jgi:hypothetical protein